MLQCGTNDRLNAILGTSTSRITNNYTLAGGSRFASNDLTYHKLSGAANLEKRLIDSDFTNSSLLSFVSRVNYDYDNRYFATLLHAMMVHLSLEQVTNGA